MTLVLGLLLPAGALALAVFGLHTWEAKHEIMDNIPAFYWEGVSEKAHNVAMCLASMLGLWYLVAWCCAILLVLFSTFPTSFWKTCHAAYVIGFFVLLFLVCLGRFSYIWVFAPVVFLGCVLGFPIYAAFMFLFPSLGPLTIYFGQSPTSSDSLRSCFYMPCSRNSISEMDQAGTLFVGLVLFVVGEVVVPVYARYKKRAVERRDFELQVVQRFAGEERGAQIAWSQGTEMIVVVLQVSTQRDELIRGSWWRKAVVLCLELILMQPSLRGYMQIRWSP